LGFLFFFSWLQEFHESLIDLFLPLNGCVVDHIFFHMRELVVDFVIFRVLFLFLSMLCKLFLFAGGASWKC